MFRYRSFYLVLMCSKAVLKMRSLIDQFGIPKAFNARYNCAYSTISKDMWWDMNRSGGPIIEQMTHFCDLARFLVGEVDLHSIKASESIRVHLIQFL